MKKILGLATAICCMFALCFSLAGCGVDKSGFTGNWSLESGTDATLDADSIALMKTLGLQVILTLNEDETGSMNMFGDKLDVTWKASSATEGEATIDGKNCTLAIADEKLTITQEDGKYLTFAKYDGEIPSMSAASAAAAAASASAAAASASAASTDADADDETQAASEGATATSTTQETTQQTTAQDTQDQGAYDEGDGTQDDEGEGEYYGETQEETYDDTTYTEEGEDEGVYYGNEGA